MTFVLSQFSLRRFYFGFLTLLGIQKKGYFIPYRYASLATSDCSEETKKVFKQSYPVIKKHLIKTADFSKDIQVIKKDDLPPLPRWNQDWFPRLDAVMAYSFVRQFKPKYIIEIGSGHSTRFMVKAIQDEKNITHFHAIDPDPRASLEDLPISFQKTTLQDADLLPFKKLSAGDIVFIDSSHIFMPGTDVDYFFQKIFPLLPKGCLLHFHDIFLPHPYPQAWEGRNYNEQDLISLLLLNQTLLPLFSSSYMLTEKPDDLFQCLKLLKNIYTEEGAYESSLWCRKNI